MNVIKLSIIFLFTFIVQHVNCDGMVEVFGWKQMDFYNRGSEAERQQSNMGGNTNKPQFAYRPPGIVFSDRAPNGRYKRKDVFTSRDESSVNFSTRWNDESASASAPRNESSYIPYNNVPMGATHFRGRLFVTMPRRRVGIPSTLNYIDMRKDGTNPSPKLYAYPNFEMNYLDPRFQPNSNRIISVYRTSVDLCQRLWFIDTGMLEYPGNRTQIQRPAIWVIDLITDRVITRFEIPQDIVDTGRGLASITVDVQPPRCNAAFAYIPDLVNNQLYVFNLANNRMWAFSHNYFNFDPLGGDLNVGGQSFRWDDGVFSTTLGPYDADDSRPVFFHAMASNNEFFVSNRVLQNETNAARSDHGGDFRVLGARGTNRQSTMHEYDPRTRVIFYDEIQRNGVGCWNTVKTFSPANHGTVAEDAQRMIYPSDLTIDEDGNIWVMTNSMPIFIYSNLDPNIVNFRIWKQNVFAAVQNTACA